MSQRLFITCIAAAAMALAACGPKPSTQAPKVEGSPDFPTGYTSWRKVNAQTIVRPDEHIAREIYARSAPNLGHGTVLVKEQYKLVGGAKGPLVEIDVMRRTGAPDNNGWSFAKYDPKTHARMGRDETACIGCHTLRADHDYLFEPKAKLLP